MGLMFSNLYQDIVSFQLYPNKVQKEFLDKELEFYHRFNKHLKKFEDEYAKSNGKFRSYREAINAFRNFKKQILTKYVGKFDSNFYLSHINFACEARAIRYNFSSNVVDGKYVHDRKTMRIEYKEQIGLYNRHLYFGSHQIRVRPDPVKNIKPSYYIIYKECDKYFLDVVVLKQAKNLKSTGVFCGIDIGFKNTITLVDTLNNIMTYKLSFKEIEKSYDKIKVYNKHINNIVDKNPKTYFKSNNYLRLLKLKAKEDRRIKRIRSRYYNEICEDIAMKYDYIAIENANINEMFLKKEFKSRLKLYCFTDFRAILNNHAKKYKKVVYRCDRYFKSSQICNKCGSIHPEMNEIKGKNERLICSCGNNEDRDVNAARNLIDEMKKNLKIEPENNIEVFKKVSSKSARKQYEQIKLFL